MLWSRLGLAEDARSLDQQFSARYTVTDGLPELLGWCADAGVEVACISNDLAEWAAARADHFGLRDALASWTISATVGARKPTPAIYSAFLATVPRSARCVFVDDRRENVMAGQRQGMYSVWFTPRSGTRPADITTASSLTELTNVLNSAASNW